MPLPKFAFLGKARRRWGTGIFVLALAWGLFLPQSVRADYWKYTGSLNVARAYHSATKLQDGRVVVIGGRGAAGVLDSAEVYNPATGTWALTGVMSSPRVNHTATLMPNGKVLVVGGEYNPVLNTVEIFDPGTMTFTPTAALNNPLIRHGAALLTTTGGAALLPTAPGGAVSVAGDGLGGL